VVDVRTVEALALDDKTLGQIVSSIGQSSTDSPREAGRRREPEPKVVDLGYARCRS